jgi:hypothetical protein
MARRVEDLDWWRLADQLRQLIIKHTAEGTPAGRDFRFTSNFRDAISSLAEVKDGIRDGAQRGHFTEDVANEMYALRRRADIANLRYLKSPDRPDPLT